MKYSIKDLQYYYNYFNKDFFKEELNYKLDSCIFITSFREYKKYNSYALEEDSGCSWIENGQNYIYITRFALNNKKIMLNILLHEMIHLYDNKINNSVRIYRGGHGSLWTKIANYATELYGNTIGKIERYSTEEEDNRLDKLKIREKEYREDKKFIKNGIFLDNCYLVQTKKLDLLPIKTLSDKEIDILKKTNIEGIYKVDLKDKKQSIKNTVEKLLTFDEILDDIENGILWDHEKMYNKLYHYLNLKNDCEKIA